MSAEVEEFSIDTIDEVIDLFWVEVTLKEVVRWLSVTTLTWAFLIVMFRISERKIVD